MDSTLLRYRNDARPGVHIPGHASFINIQTSLIPSISSPIYMTAIAVYQILLQ